MFFVNKEKVDRLMMNGKPLVVLFENQYEVGSIQTISYRGMESHMK